MNGSNARTIVDTGPLVAAMNADDQHHVWAREVFAGLAPPVFTCEAVLSEAQFLLQERGGEPLAVCSNGSRWRVNLAFNAEDEIERLIQLQRSYRNLPMDFPDACLVRMTELHERARVMTTDSGFRLYRRNRRQVIPMIAPVGV